tara:strand:- start:2002 stop:2835 length:834 start_codon:yes stop_codon:yes gene_type:complete
MKIYREFIDIAEGQAHFRYTPDSSDKNTPLILVHMSPVASAFLVPLMNAIGDKERRLIAPDTLGNGDSSPPTVSNPQIIDFADGLIQILDIMNIKEAHFYGIRTGAMIATEIAIKQPHRVKSLVLDDLVIHSHSESSGSIGEPCPKIDFHGSQINWAWHVIRDHFIWLPWWERSKNNRIILDLPSAESLHTNTVELTKAIETFHLSYNAAQAWPREERLPLIQVPTMIPYEPSHTAFPDTRPTAKIIKNSKTFNLPEGDTTFEAKGEIIKNWLNSET